jgi:site-specific recombinase XerD
MEDVLSQLRQDLARTGYAESTQIAYVQTCTLFVEEFQRPVDELGREHVRAFIAKLEARGRSASWMKMKLGALVYLFRRTLGRPNEVSFVSFPRQHSPLPTVLCQEEVSRVFGAIQVRIYLGVALVLYGTGVRLREALSLEVRDIDGGRGVIRVRHGKGNKAREVKLTPTLLDWLRRYWAAERPAPPYLFASRRTGRPPGQAAVRAALALASVQAGITKRVTPHALRHSYATHMLDAGVDIRVIQALLGHARLDTTARYARVSTQRIESAPSPVDLLPLP